MAGAPVDGASVAAFRVIFGLTGVLVVARFFAHGWIGPLYVEPDYHFTYRGELVEPRGNPVLEQAISA